MTDKILVKQYLDLQQPERAYLDNILEDIGNVDTTEQEMRLLNAIELLPLTRKKDIKDELAEKNEIKIGLTVAGLSSPVRFGEGANNDYSDAENLRLVNSSIAVVDNKVMPETVSSSENLIKGRLEECELGQGLISFDCTFNHEGLDDAAFLVLLNLNCSDQYSIAQCYKGIMNKGKDKERVILNKDFAAPCEYDQRINNYFAATRNVTIKTHTVEGGRAMPSKTGDRKKKEKVTTERDWEEYHIGHLNNVKTYTYPQPEHIQLPTPRISKPLLGVRKDEEENIYKWVFCRLEDTLVRKTKKDRTWVIERLNRCCGLLRGVISPYFRITSGNNKLSFEASDLGVKDAREIYEDYEKCKDFIISTVFEQKIDVEVWLWIELYIVFKEGGAMETLNREEKITETKRPYEQLDHIVDDKLWFYPRVLLKFFPQEKAYYKYQYAKCLEEAKNLTSKKMNTEQAKLEILRYAKSRMKLVYNGRYLECENYKNDINALDSVFIQNLIKQIDVTKVPTAQKIDKRNDIEKLIDKLSMKGDTFKQEALKDEAIKYIEQTVGREMGQVVDKQLSKYVKKILEEAKTKKWPGYGNLEKSDLTYGNA